MHALVLLALLWPSTASAQERVRLGPRADEGEAVESWIAERVRHARTGTRDTVRLPLVFQSDGWGCVCPLNYVGVDSGYHAGGDTWLKVDNQSGAQFPTIPSRREDDGEGGHYDSSEGMVVRVDGHFTGDVERVVMNNERDWTYELNVFVVTRIHRRMRSPQNARVAILSSTEAGICERTVQDDSPLNVRDRPHSRGGVVGTLPSGTRVRPVRWRGHRWIRIESPIAGWVWVANTRQTCAERTTR